MLIYVNVLMRYFVMVVTRDVPSKYFPTGDIVIVRDSVNRT